MTPVGRPLDNPINWSFTLGRVWGINIRVHVAFLICAVVLVWMEIPKGDASPNWSAWEIVTGALGIYAILFAIVLLHEFGHCFGARSVGGRADEILIWPLGGLASVQPPHDPRSHLVTTLSGPMVNVAICGVCSALLAAWCGTLAAVPWNPLHPLQPVDSFLYLTTGQVWLTRVFGISYFLLLVNLLPIFPFDGGRVLQSVLWARKDYLTATEIATGVGMVGAVLIGLFALFIDQSWLLLMVAIFGYMTCWQTRRVLREQGAFEGLDGSLDFGQHDYRSHAAVGEDARPRMGMLARRRARKALRAAQEERASRQRHQEAVDEILRKVAKNGMNSLTAAERRVLEEETRRIRE